MEVWNKFLKIYKILAIPKKQRSIYLHKYILCVCLEFRHWQQTNRPYNKISKNHIDISVFENFKDIKN